MKNRVYSKASDIPKGTASKVITDGCVVLEGGAFRWFVCRGRLGFLYAK